MSADSTARASPLAAPRLADVDEAALDEIKRYESFSTVDWLVDGARQRARAARKRAQRSRSSEWGNTAFAPHERPPYWWPTGTLGARKIWLAWLFLLTTLAAALDNGVVVIVGAVVGVNMAVISIVTEWLSDLKQGHCSGAWWLNRKFCCWAIHEPAGGGQHVVRPVPQVISIAPLLNSSLPSAPTATFTPSGTRHVARQVLAHVGAAAEWYQSSLAVRGTSEELSDVCSDWVPWSTWTIPAWLVYVLWAALMAFLSAWLVRTFAPYAAGSGISEIKCMIAGFIINGFLGVSTFAIKSLTLPLVIASGLSVGKEGPAVHVACCVGNIVSNLFRRVRTSQAKVRDILCASSAAGVAVAFGSPIGGVLFSLEEMTHVFPATTMWRSFLCALASTVTLSFMNPFRTGKLVLFQVSYDRDWHYFEVFFYIIIGVFGGLYGAFVIKYNMQMQAFRRAHLAGHGVSEAVVLAVVTAAVAYYNKFLSIDMSESLEILFRECEGGGDYAGLCQTSEQWHMVNSLLLATALRFALVVLSYGAKVPAGIFIPSMAIGATFGRMVGILVKALHNALPNAALFSACHPDVPCITPGTYAFLGAAAALAGVTRITVAVVVIMFELTGALTYILPTMIVVMITKGVADSFKPGGVSDQSIRLNGYPFLEETENSDLDDTAVQMAMTSNPVCLVAKGETVASLEDKLNTGDYKGFPVIVSKANTTLVGYIGRTELRYALAKAKRDRTVAPDAHVSLALPSEAGAAHLPDPDAEETLRFSGHHQAPEQEGLINDEQADKEDQPAEEPSRSSGVADGVLVARRVDLGAWVDATRLVVAPVMPLAVAKELFTKLGPRVILVADRGYLVGLVTIKDLLKFAVAHEKAATNLARAEWTDGEVEAATAYDADALGPEPSRRGEWEGVVTDVLTWGQAMYGRLRARWHHRPLASQSTRVGYAPTASTEPEVVVFDSSAGESENIALTATHSPAKQVDSNFILGDEDNYNDER